MSRSMGLLLHHWKDITNLWVDTVTSPSCQEEALAPLLECLASFVHDLRTTILPLYPTILAATLKILPSNHVAESGEAHISNRRFTPTTLSSVLKTLTSLFKYTLVPLPQLLKPSWTLIHRSMVGLVSRRSSGVAGEEMQRMLAEVWGLAIRQFTKQEVRDEAVSLLVDVLEDCEEGIAHVFTSAVQATFAKHVSSPKHFEPISRYLVQTYERELEAEYINTEERVCRMWRLLSLVCATKKGVRVEQKHISTLLKLTASTTLISPSLSKAQNDILIEFCVSVLTAGDTTCWNGPGRLIIQKIWEHDQFLGLRFSTTLAQLKWPGWKLLVSPLVVQHSLPLLQSQNHSSSSLRMIANLHALNLLGDIDEATRREVGTWVTRRLDPQSWTVGIEDNVHDLDSIAILGSFLPPEALIPSLLPVVASIMERFVDVASSQADYKSMAANSAWTLATCFKAMAGNTNNGDIAFPGVDLEAWTRRIVEVWSWNSDVLSSYLQYLDACPSRTTDVVRLQLPYVFSHLRGALSSPYQTLRLSGLRFLVSKYVTRPPADDSILQKLLTAEEVPISVAGQKERVYKISVLATWIGDIEFEYVVPWLIAQLKVNFRPLWSASIKALSGIAQSHPHRSWNVIFSDLQMVAPEGEGHQNPEGLGVLEASWHIAGTPGDDEEPRETEKNWDDSDRRVLLSAISKWGQDAVDNTTKRIAQAQTPESQLDIANYETQLINLLTQQPHIVENNHLPFVTFFLEQNSPRMQRSRLVQYLTLFSKFKKPWTIHESDLLHSFYMSLLTETDKPLQRVALSCVLTYKSPNLKPFETKLKEMLDDIRWREAMTNWTFEELTSENREEVINVLMRLLYGLLLNKKSKSKSTSRRNAILALIGGAHPEELHILANLMLTPFGGLERLMEHHAQGSSSGVTPYTLRGTNEARRGQMAGFLFLLEDAMRILGTKLKPFWPAFVAATIEITASMQTEVDGAMNVDEPDREIEEADPVEDEEKDEEEHDEVLKDASHEDAASDHSEPEEEGRSTDGHPRRKKSSTKAARDIRNLAFKRLIAFFSAPLLFSYQPYLPAAFSAFITPRLRQMHRENLAKPGSFLPLFVAWSKEREYFTFLHDYEPTLLDTVVGCLKLPRVGGLVIQRILDILSNLLEYSADDSDAERIIRAHLDSILDAFHSLMERMTSTPKPDSLLQRLTQILSSVAPFITSADHGNRLLPLLIPPLQKGPRVAPEKVKVNLLHVLESLVAVVPEMKDPESTLFNSTYRMLSGLLDTVRMRETREAVIGVFKQMAVLDESLVPVKNLLIDLNLYEARTGEIHVNRRLAGYGLLNDNLYRTLTPKQWLPVIFSAFSVIREQTEFTVKGAATLALRRVVERASEPNAQEMQDLFTRTVHSRLVRSLEVGQEEIRAEVLGIFSYAAEKGLPSVQELQPLLKRDRDSDILLNLYHIQSHHRLRAIRALGHSCASGRISSTTISTILLPVINGYIIGVPKQSLTDEAIVALGRMAGWLDWNPYYATFVRYLSLAKSKKSEEKYYIRAVIAILDHFHFSVEDASIRDAVEQDEIPAMDPEDAEEAVEVVQDEQTASQARIADTIRRRILPDLLRFIEVEQPEDASRLAMSVGIAKVALHLPKVERDGQIMRLLTILSQTLRSKSQDLRTAVRQTLVNVAVAVGPGYLPTLIKELRMALTRGPQVYVLATVVHSVLNQMASPDHAEKLGTLDDCVDDAVQVASEVVFGEAASNTLRDGFKTSTREASGSSNRGQEIFMILAKHVSPSKVNRVLEPIRAIMHETVALRMMNLVDEVLRRVAVGLDANPLLEPHDILGLCHSLIGQNAKFLEQAPRFKKRKGKIHRDIAVNLKLPRVAETITNHYANNSFRFVAFGLELFNTSYRKGRFDLEDSETISRLEPFVTIIGNTLYSNQAKVITQGLRSTAAIVKCPLEALPPALPAFVKRIVAIVQQAGNTESEVVQTAFKALGVILRQHRDVDIKEEDLTYILGLLIPDLEELSRQETSFSLLQTFLVRKYVVPEIYDAMDRVAEVLVRSSTNRARMLSRNLYLHFLTQYPQGKNRVKESMEFLAKNLSYAHESGRKSVMETINRVFAEFNPNVLSKYHSLFFLGLVMVLANDDSAKCREMGANLLTSLFQRMSDPEQQQTMGHLHIWAEQDSKPALRRVSVQLYGIFMEVLGTEKGQPHLQTTLQDLKVVTEESVRQFQQREMDQDDGDEALDQEERDRRNEEWQLAHQVLTALSKILRLFPDAALQLKRVPWKAILSLMTYPHTWVRAAATRLQGILYTSVAAGKPDSSLPLHHPLSFPSFVASVKSLCIQLKSNNIEPPLALQVVKNLFYIGKCFYLLNNEEAMRLLVLEDEDQDDRDEKIANATRRDEQGVEDGDNKQDGEEFPGKPEAEQKPPLEWMFSKLAYLARGGLHKRRMPRRVIANWAEAPCSAIRWFAAMTSHVDDATVETHLNPMLSTIYRVLEGDLDGDAQSDELKTLATELQDLLRKRVGGTKYSFAYNEVRQKALTLRTERRAQKAIQAVADPETFLQEKAKRGAAQRVTKKRKAQEERKGRETKKHRNW
ncbi:U3 snoRNP protein [Tulasnella sp. 403]|nr:U3 snoRNP protein [Tulasnella sp. 403]